MTLINIKYRGEVCKATHSASVQLFKVSRKATLVSQLFLAGVYGLREGLLRGA